ncbi:hypothetical protein KFU94_66665 [Chloroflexi bacterium TSY]|nr:hypothetical protein [Chloroflexi bacterium TSY]
MNEETEHTVSPDYIAMAHALYDSTVNDGASVPDSAEQILDQLPDDAALQRSIVWFAVSTSYLICNNMHAARDAAKRALDVRGTIADARNL